MTLLPQIASLLRAATDAERTARGSERRRAFATTRYLIAAVLQSGAPAQDIATVLGVMPSTVATRGITTGPIDADTLTALSTITAIELARWEAAGLLHPIRHATGTSYFTGDVIAALIAMTRPW